MAKNRKQFAETLYNYQDTYRIYYDYVSELAVSMFEWKNLPESVDERYLELTLFENGQIAFFVDDVLGYLALPCALNGNFNVYRIPKNRRAYASNGYNKELSDENSVIIYNNFLRKNSKKDVNFYARKLANIDMAIMVNANAQKTPVLVQCDETQRLTMLNLYQKYEGNEPFIFADKNLNAQGIKVLKTDAPYVADRLTDLKTHIWNEAMTHLGISNINIVKKERLISDEVMRNQGGTIASRYSRLEMRRKACAEINAMFGLDIWCDYREDYREVDEDYSYNPDTDPDDTSLLTKGGASDE